MQVERTGIIASFILNASMIPGWPPTTGPGSQYVHAEPSALPIHTMTEDEALSYLANLGVTPALTDKLDKRLAKVKRRKRILSHLATLLKAMAVAFDVLAAELKSALEEQRACEGNRHRGNGSGSRHWLSLECSSAQPSHLIRSMKSIGILRTGAQFHAANHGKHIIGGDHRSGFDHGGDDVGHPCQCARWNIWRTLFTDRAGLIEH